MDEIGQLLELQDGVIARRQALTAGMTPVAAHSARIGDGQVFERACWTASKIACLLRLRGWQGSFRCCPACPADLRAELERIV